MQKSDLDNQLGALQSAATEQTDAYESSRDKLYQNMVDTYLWWRQAEQSKGYLKAKYAENGIRTRQKASNKPNFYPVVRLVWNIDITKKASTVSDWSQSLLSLHELYTAEESRFSQNARADLINHIRDVGGLSELRGEQRMTEQELYDEEDADIAEPKKTDKSTQNDPSAEVVQSKSTLAKSVEPKAKLPVFPSAVTNADEFVVMLARRNPTSNELEVVGTSADEELMQNALNRCVDVDRSNIASSLRLIAEALTPHAVPPKLEKHRKKFFDKSKTVKRLQPNGKTEKVAESTSLLIEPTTNEIIVTKSPKRLTCVTHVKPKQIKLHDGETLVMRGADRSWFEQELIGKDQLSLYAAEPTDALKETHTKEKNRYGLTLTNSATKQTRTAYFYELSELPVETNDGNRIDADSTFEADWEITATPHWMTAFNSKCVDEWINAIKGYFNKPQNKKVSLSVSDKALTLQYWWDKDASAYLKTFSMPIDNGTTITVNNEAEAIELFPKDAMLLFSAIPTLPLSSNAISIKGSADGLFIEYETDLASYRSFLPSYAAFKSDEAVQKKAAKKAASE
jgi:hypothetical protein